MTGTVYLMEKALHRAIKSAQRSEISDDARRKMALAEPLNDEDKQSLAIHAEIWGAGSKSRDAPDNLSQPGMYSVVSEAFKDAVETLELGRHQFVPLTVTWRDTGETAGQYYWFLCSDVVDHYDVERTEWLSPEKNKFGQAAAEKSRFRPTFRNAKSTVVRAERVAGKHLWRASVPRIKPLFCSEDFADFLRSRTRSGIKLMPISMV